MKWHIFWHCILVSRYIASLCIFMHCTGIIRKTRTVMECLHRFCRECIDKSMRLGNNECPACRTHCASRRSLRDDTNYDSLIAALYPDIDKYEEEELAFHEEDKNRNKKIQASIAEIFRRQSEALARKRSTAKATAAAFMRRSQGAGQNCYLRGRGKASTRIASPTVTDDDDEEDAVVDDAGKDYSSGEEASSPDRRPKKCRRVVAHRSSPARLSSNASLGSNANDDVEVNRENFHTSPLRAGNRELSWGKGGARSQTRHGSTNGSNGRFVKAARLAKLTEYLRNLDENESKFDIHVTLLHFDEQAWPLGSPYFCCPATSSIRHIRQFIAIQTSAEVEDIDIFVRKTGCDPVDRSDQAVMVLTESPKELQKLRAEELLIELLSTYASRCGNLELVYSINVRRER
ncbi:hypothetical protein HPP92_017547 [Vanilla planifolia]|uniref:RING-type domain-containing protein n=1 Tax=Vanilla planifolia TaxID=51239 RepID=A0A835QNB6_VANPL|nr:hypothetical protein HPP92_017547 [Vanilla planifolia]